MFHRNRYSSLSGRMVHHLTNVLRNRIRTFLLRPGNSLLAATRRLGTHRHPSPIGLDRKVDFLLVLPALLELSPEDRVVLACRRMGLAVPHLDGVPQARLLSMGLRDLSHRRDPSVHLGSNILNLNRTRTRHPRVPRALLRPDLP